MSRESCSFREFCCAIAVVMCMGTVAHAAYAPGYVWNRQAVWYGGTGDGSTTGNPNLDSVGNPAWLYTARNGATFGSSWWTDPNPSVLGSFAPGGSPRWVGGNAYAFQDRFYHEHGGAAAPGVDWLNPTGQSVAVNVNGSMQFNWEMGAPHAVDYVIAKQNLTTHSATALYQTTVSPSGPTSRTISLPNVALAANEGLIFTYRAQSGSVGLYTGSDLVNVTLAQTANGAFVQLDPKRTYLRSDTPDAAIPISLSGLGINPGDMIELRQLGDFTPNLAEGSPDTDQDLIALFSSSSTLLSNSTHNRVPGALTSGLPGFFTDATYYGQLATDIPEDFKISPPGITVQVPADAAYIFAAPYDVYYGDNGDPNNNFGLSITVVPEPTSLALGILSIAWLARRRH